MSLNEIILLSGFNLILFFVINFLLLKKEILIDKVLDKDTHKNFVNSEVVPLSGGVILLLNCFIFNFFDNFYYLICFAFLFLIGLLSDTANLESPAKRLFMQILLILLFLFYQEILIDSVRINFIDQLLKNKFFSLIFTTFCLLILINGSNFIDGMNFQSSGYYLALLASLIFFNSETINQVYPEIFSSLFFFLIIFIFFNIQNKSFLGDSGIYLLSFIIGLLLIEMQKITNVSPYYVVVLLWYPAFENLFSICRRVFVKKSKPEEADIRHLHHYLIKYLKLKFDLDNKKISLLASIFINLFNFIFFSFSVSFIYSTKVLLLLIILLCITYLFIYNFLSKTKNQ